MFFEFIFIASLVAFSASLSIYSKSPLYFDALLRKKIIHIVVPNVFYSFVCWFHFSSTQFHASAYLNSFGSIGSTRFGVFLFLFLSCLIWVLRKPHSVIAPFIKYWDNQQIIY